MKKLAIVTYNMRCPSGEDGINFFPNRVPLIAEAVRRLEIFLKRLKEEQGKAD